MSPNPFVGLLSNRAIPTVKDWQAVRNFGLLHISPNPSRRQINCFYILAGCMLLIAVLHSINLLNTLMKKKPWLFKKDRAGYWYPSHTLMPMLYCIMSLLVFISIMLQSSDYHKSFRASTVMTQMLSYHILYFCGVTISWRILGALPSSPFHFRERDDVPISSTSPRAFNAFICTLYLAFPLLLLPLQVCMAKNIATTGALWVQIMAMLSNLINHEGRITETQLQGLSWLAITMLQTLERHMARSGLLRRVMCGVLALFIAVQLIVFTYASIRLLMTLGKQLNVIKRAKAHAEELAKITVSETHRSPSISLIKHNSEPDHTQKPLHWVWIGLASNVDFEPHVWHDSNDQEALETVWHLEEKHKANYRYRNIVALQLGLIGASIVSYLALAVCLTFSAASILHTSHPGSEADVIFFAREWADFALVVPGVPLAIIGCCTSFMSCLSGRVQNDIPRDLTTGLQESSGADPCRGFLADTKAPQSEDSAEIKICPWYPSKQRSKTVISALLPCQTNQSSHSSIIRWLSCDPPHLNQTAEAQSFNHQPQPITVHISDRYNRETPQPTDPSVTAYAFAENRFGGSLTTQIPSHIDVIRFLRAKDASDIEAHQTSSFGTGV